MAEPTLSDITNITVDPERATGNAAVIYDSKEMVRNLNNAAQFKAENDWKKYTQFLTNLKDAYKDVNEIAKMEVMTEDRDKLKSQMGDIIKGISSDPKGFFGGGAKYQETLGKISQLQSEATESKANKIYDFAHRQYFYRNPELDTPANRAAIDNFRKESLGSRNPYLLKIPGYYNGDVLGMKINEMVKSITKTPIGDENSPFIDELTQVKYDPAKYRLLAERMFEMPNEKGETMRSTLQERLDSVPELKRQYEGSPDPVKQFYFDDILPRLLEGSSSTERKSNPNYLDKQNLAEKIRAAKADEAIKRDHLNYLKNKDKGAGIEDAYSADAVLMKMKDAVNQGVPRIRGLAGGGTEEQIEIADPFLLKEFGTISKDGTTTEVPNKFYFSPKKNTMSLVYYKTDYNGDFEKNESGKFIVKKEIPMNVTDWVTTIVKQKNPNKDIGSINRIVQGVLNQYKGNLKDLAEKYGEVSTKNPEKNKNVLIFPDGTSIDLNENSLTEDQIKAAIKAGAKKQ